MSQDPLDTENTICHKDEQTGFTLTAGSVLGQYRIIRPLGRGGMGEVYEVEHGTLERRYALKLLPADFAAQPGALERFRREAKVMANLEHPNIIRVDDFGEMEGRYWLRMELASGVQGSAVHGSTVGGSGAVVSLQELAEARGGRIAQEELVEILKQILEGLVYAHGHGAIHRDLKPSNILFSGGVAKISDFGLVRLVGEEWVCSQAQISVQNSMSIGEAKTIQMNADEGTSTRSMLGTYEYMSPEQKRGEEATAQSDLYAVGLMVFKLLTGQNPGVKPPSRIDRELAGGWDEFVEKALEEKAGERWANAKAMQGELGEIGQALGARQAEKAAEARRSEAVRRTQVEADRQAREGEEERQRSEQKRLAEEVQARRREKEANRLREKERLASPPQAKQISHSGRWIWVLMALAVGGYALWSQYQPTLPSRFPVVPATPEPQPSVASSLAGLNQKLVAPTATCAPDLASPFSNSLGMELVPVAGLDGVLFCKWETRVQDFRAFVEDRANNKGYDYQSGQQPFVLRAGEWKQRGWDYGWDNPGFDQLANHPVTCVSWDDAKAFCAWLTQVEQAKRTIGKDQKYRLPTDAEWSKAIGLSEGDGSPSDKDLKRIAEVYPWGTGQKPPPRFGNYGGEEARDADWESGKDVISGYNDGFPRTSPVGQFGAKHGELCDMGGNVWEWCEDSFFDQGVERVLRGASWSNSAGSLRSSHRGLNVPDGRLDHYGFRVVLSR